mmetsp:Transcript_19853/g.63901  ORF Transcript_19853/g.63901 Transcript_19853/m.63901 type:complete len:277 (-) Transcript_19853:61-891(-)
MGTPPRALEPRAAVVHSRSFTSSCSRRKKAAARAATTAARNRRCRRRDASRSFRRSGRARVSLVFRSFSSSSSARRSRALVARSRHFGLSGERRRQHGSSSSSSSKPKPRDDGLLLLFGGKAIIFSSKTTGGAEVEKVRGPTLSIFSRCSARAIRLPVRRRRGTQGASVSDRLGRLVDDVGSRKVSGLVLGLGRVPGRVMRTSVQSTAFSGTRLTGVADCDRRRSAASAFGTLRCCCCVVLAVASSIQLGSPNDTWSCRRASLALIGRTTSDDDIS